MAEETFDEAKLPVITEIGPTTGVAAAQAAAVAEIQAAYAIAKYSPRDPDKARIAMLRTCKRSSFADDKSALYKKPVGGGESVEGPGIRLAEEMARHWGNLRICSEVVEDHRETCKVSVSVTDLETNTTYSSGAILHKLIERHTVRKGQQVIGQRESTKGKTLYIIRATPEEMLTSTNREFSKLIRNGVLREIPQDITQDCVVAIKETRQTTIAQDPDEAVKKITEAFASINVEPDRLQELLGCRLREASPAQIEELRSIFGAIRDGETTFNQVLDNARQTGSRREEGNLKAEDFKPGKTPPAESRKESSPSQSGEYPVWLPGDVWDKITPEQLKALCRAQYRRTVPRMTQKMQADIVEYLRKTAKENLPF